MVASEPTPATDAKQRIFPMAVPWTESPFFELMLEEAALSPEEKEMVSNFARDGYLVFDPQLPAGMIDQVVSELDGRYTDTATGYDNPSRVMDAWKFNERIREIAVMPRILQVLEMLYRRAPIPFQTLNFEVGTEQPTHSDTIHFQTVPANFMAGVWVAFEDIDEDNGPLHYYPGSHRLPNYDLHHLGLSAGVGNYHKYEEFLQALFELGKFPRVELSMKKGQALIWSANLAHGGTEIRDRRRTRLSQVTHYYFEGCMYYTPMLSEPFMKSIDFRTERLKDIRTGVPIPHYFNGNPVQHTPPAEPPAKSLIRQFVPPILLDARAKLRDKAERS